MFDIIARIAAVVFGGVLVLAVAVYLISPAPPPPNPQQEQEAAAWRRAEQKDAEQRRAAEAARTEAEAARTEEKRERCRIAAACKKYDDARTECAMAGNVTTCVRIKMGDAVRYFDLCSNSDRSLPPASPAHFTAAPNVIWCWLETSSR
jgi:hypothetical protein